MFRVGIGQDSHRFSDDGDKTLILGGVKIPGERGFYSNSDGDVIIHALCNALESAIGGVSFSVYADKMHEQKIDDSFEYLNKALENVDKSGYKVNNIGISIEAKFPKINPLSAKIKKNISEAVNILESCVGITSTSGEELTAFGKGEGIQVFVIVSLVKK